MFFGMEFTEWLAWLTLLVGVPVSAYATYRLRKKVRRSKGLWVLGERYGWQVGVTLFTLVFGVIFLNNDQPEPWLDVDTTKWVTRLAVLALSVILSTVFIVKDHLARRRRKASNGT